MAAITGLPPAWLADLDEAGVDAVSEVAEERAQLEVWGTTQELLATAVDTLRQIAGLLVSGVPVGMVSRFGRVPDVTPYPRPDWAGGARTDGETVTPRELFGRLKG